MASNLVISGYSANPPGTDSPFEYVQVVATQAIDFSATPYTIVFTNNGTATTNGWVQGLAISYAFSITTGTLAAGQVAYVGGSGRLINGTGSTDISGATWLRFIDTGTTAGDTFGSLNTGGVLGNGGGNADGIAIFDVPIATITSTTVPIDAIFFGTGVGTANPATGGYTLPTNDLYNNAQGTFGDGTNTFIFADPVSGSFTRLTGTYNPTTSTWTTPRTASQIALTATSTLADIAPAITLGGGATPTVTLSVTANAGTEAGTTAITVTATASAAVTGDQTVALTVTGTGITTGDYTLTNTTITIPNGATTGAVTFTVVDDALAEGTETATLTIGTPSAGITLGATTSQTIAITDNDNSVVRIHTIQGSAANQIAVSGRTDGSPLNGQAVTIEGVVTADFQDSQLRGFFIQEEDSDRDNNTATSEGIFVFTGTTPVLDVQEGQVVRVTGNVSEFFGMTQVTATAAGSLQVLNAGNNLNLVTPAAIDLPPTGDINTFYEQYEGMKVRFVDKLFVSEYFELARYGQVILDAGSRPYQYSHTDNTPTAAEYTTFLDTLNRNRIILDDDNNTQNAPLPSGRFFYPQPNGFGTGTQGTNYFRGGDSISNLTGVLHWSFAGQTGTDAWRIRPTQANPATFTVENPRPTTPPAVGGNVKVASFNVLNYFNTIDTVGGTNSPRGADSTDEFDRQNAKLIEALISLNADVFGLIEIENNGDAANPAVRELVTRLNARLGSEVYDYIRTGKVGTDQITNAFIYKKAVLEPRGAAAVLTAQAFVNPNNFTQDRNRPAIAQTFRVIDINNPDFGESFNVVVNHLKSKGGSDALGADVDQNDGQGQFNDTRNKAANYLVNTWLPSDPTGQGDSDYLIIGDLNSYKGEAPITTIKNAGYTDLVEQFGGNNAYGYLFSGQLGYLDHALANNALRPQVTGVAEWHINADEVPVFDYNNNVDDGAGESSFEAKPTGNNLYEVNAFRTSDHDPVLVGLNLGGSTPRLNNIGSNNGNSNAFDVFRITGGGTKSQVKFTLTGINTTLVNELGIFAVDDAAGTINGIAPGAAGYAQAALNRGQVVFSAIANAPNGFNATNLSRLLALNTDSQFRFYLVKNSTTDSVLKQLTPLSDVVFAASTALRITSGTNQFTLAWQDGSSNTSTSFNSLVATIEATSDAVPQGSSLQGNTESELIDLRTATTPTTVNFTVNREAAFNNYVGFYRVANTQGGIDTNNDGTADVLVGQSGYIQAAISRRVAGIDLTVNNQGTASYTGTFQPGSIFAPFIIADGRPDALLDSNTSNDPAVYFPFLGANADRVDHIRLLGNNVFGFEDLPSGGDRDYNDVIVTVRLT